MKTPKQFILEHYQLPKSKIELIRIKSVIRCVERYMEYYDSEKRCRKCRFWKKNDNNSAEDTGKCGKISAPVDGEIPNFIETGIESYPVCDHDGPGSEYETKEWFYCSHFTSPEIDN